jgi:hypothetical protein
VPLPFFAAWFATSERDVIAGVVLVDSEGRGADESRIE